MREKSVSEALKQLAKRQAVRQYSARPPLKIETNKWMQPVENTDNSADSGDNVRIDRVTASTDRVTGRTDRVTGRTDRVTGRTDRVTAHSHYPTKRIQSDKPVGTSGDNQSDGSNTRNDSESVDKRRTFDVHEGIQGDTRYRNADQTFFSLVQNELQVTSKPAHTRETPDNRQSKGKSESSVISMDSQSPSIDRDGPSRIIRIPCGDDSTDMVSTGDTVDKLGSARQDYNKHMQMLIERLAAHKFSNPSMEAIVPKPPTRPRSAKRPVSAQRMAR